MYVLSKIYLFKNNCAIFTEPAIISDTKIVYKNVNKTVSELGKQREQSCEQILDRPENCNHENTKNLNLEDNVINRKNYRSYNVENLIEPTCNNYWKPNMLINDNQSMTQTGKGVLSNFYKKKANYSSNVKNINTNTLESINSGYSLNNLSFLATESKKKLDELNDNESVFLKPVQQGISIQS